jgi:hypothetical protein
MITPWSWTEAAFSYVEGWPGHDRGRHVPCRVSRLVGSTAGWYGLPKRDEMPIDIDEGLHGARPLKYVRCLPVGWGALCADCD